MNDRLIALKLFTRAARLGSFSGAGRELGVSQPSASRLIATLETEIGAALFTRTTRAVNLTEAGATYLARVEPILAALDEADHEARGTGELRGTLRIGVSSSFAIREVIPRLQRFIRDHKALRVELVMSDQYQDLVIEGLDVALRFGTLADSSAVARKIFESPRILAASPAYVAEHGAPTAPADLAHHTVIMGPAESPVLSLRRNGRVASVRVGGRVAISQHEGALAGAAAGLGIARLTGSCRENLVNGQLVPVLPDWDIGSMEVHAVYASGKTAKPAARAFTDFLIGQFRDAR
jgi:DNA-binding transcriptional LysR family regulator